MFKKITDKCLCLFRGHGRDGTFQIDIAAIFSAASVEGGILRRPPGREAAQLGAKVKMAFAMCACEKSGGPPLETSQQ